jgi:hypothetical protein
MVQNFHLKGRRDEEDENYRSGEEPTSGNKSFQGIRKTEL